MSFSITGFGLEECKQTSALFRAIYTYRPPEIYIVEELWEFYYARPENIASHLQDQQRKSNHTKRVYNALFRLCRNTEYKKSQGKRVRPRK